MDFKLYLQEQVENKINSAAENLITISSLLDVNVEDVIEMVAKKARNHYNDLREWKEDNYREMAEEDKQDYFPF